MSSTVIVYGGAGALGRSIVKAFRTANWVSKLTFVVTFVLEFQDFILSTYNPFFSRIYHHIVVKF
jgi:hypothetical protein